MRDGKSVQPSRTRISPTTASRMLTSVFPGVVVTVRAVTRSPTTVTTMALRLLRIASSGSPGSVAPSRTAETGGTIVARIPGYRLASTVTTIPTVSATTIVRVSSVNPLFGRVNPTASNSRKRPFARARPTTRPTSEASTPVTSASTSTDPSTCRRDAPSVRSVANSRVRCAIVIESEFAITNAPTNSATPPNARRNFCRNERKSVTSDASLVACAAPVLTWVVGGRMPCTCEMSCSGETPPLAAIRIWSSLPCLSNRCWAVARSKPASVAPPIDETAPNFTIPEMRNFSTGPRDCTPIVWPTWRSFLPEVDLSTTTSPAFGQAPW